MARRADTIRTALQELGTSKRVGAFLGVGQSQGNSYQRGAPVPSRYLWRVLRWMTRKYGREEALKRLLGSLRAWDAPRRRGRRRPVSPPSSSEVK